MFKRKGLWWKLPLAAFGILIGISTLIGGLSKVSGKHPKCDSSSSIRTVKSVFNKSPRARIQHLEAIDVSDIIEVSKSEDELNCSGTIFTNAAGRH